MSYSSTSLSQVFNIIQNFITTIFCHTAILLYSVTPLYYYILSHRYMTTCMNISMHQHNFLPHFPSKEIGLCLFCCSSSGRGKVLETGSRDERKVRETDEKFQRRRQVLDRRFYRQVQEPGDEGSRDKRQVLETGNRFKMSLFNRFNRFS